MKLNISFSDFMNAKPEETAAMKAETKKRIAISKFMAKHSKKGNVRSSRPAPIPIQSTSSQFRNNYRVDPPPRPSDSEIIWEMKKAAAIAKMTDGKGDHECGHEH